MSNVSIFEKKWLDLVFEGKNQEYGAYQLRRDSSKTTLFALLFGSTFLLGGTFLLSSFNSAPVEEFGIPITLHPSVNVEPYKPNEVKPKVEHQKVKANPVETPVDTKNYVVTETSKARPDIPKTTPATTPATTPTDGGGGTGTPSDTPSTGGGTLPLPKPADNGTHGPAELDRQPNFPGGMKGFYQYVGENFEKQNIEEGTTIRVLVSFVIEKNGTMTDIKVLQNSNPDIDREAVRVLKSLKTKWTPGIKDGEPVRTQFTLPIAVKSE